METTRRVAIIGPEATGKTLLAAELARAFNGVATPEFAREYFTTRKLNGNHQLSRAEMEEVMQGQANVEAGASARLVLVDASCFHGIIYSAMYRGGDGKLHFDLADVSRKVMDYAHQGRYDGFILCWPDADLPWEDDPLRGLPDLQDRMHLADACYWVRRMLFPAAFCVDVRGNNWHKRTKAAIDGLKRELANV